MQKFTIQNRHGLKIVGNISIPENPKGLAFVVHGLGGYKEQACIQEIVKTFFDNNYTVVNFDGTNSNGESGGKYEDATTMTFKNDFEDVVEYFKTQPIYKEPFFVAGHSRGGYAAVVFAENYPNLVKGVFAFAPFISGKLHIESKNRIKPEELKNWEETGWEIRKSVSKPDLELRLPYSFMEEAQNHDLTDKVSNLTMPTLILVGENDTSHPFDQQQMFHNLLPENTEREFYIVKGAPHTFREPEHLEQLKNILDNWLKKLK